MAKKARLKRVKAVLEDQHLEASVIRFPAKRTKAKKKAMPVDVEMPPLPVKELVCRTQSQSHYKQSIESTTITFGVGPAGTGKSYVALKLAAQMLDRGEIQQIIITRPAVAVDEELGAIPGNLEEKVRPWFQPLLDILAQHYGQSHMEGMLHSKRIIFVPISHLRGRTFDHCFILLDEAQNTTVRQMQALLTRIGRYSKLVVDGDVEQCDLRTRSGLEDALERLKYIPGVNIVRFGVEDIVRHSLIKDIILAYRRPLTVSPPTANPIREERP